MAPTRKYMETHVVAVRPACWKEASDAIQKSDVPVEAKLELLRLFDKFGGSVTTYHTDAGSCHESVAIHISQGAKTS